MRKISINMLRFESLGNDLKTMHKMSKLPVFIGSGPLSQGIVGIWSKSRDPTFNTEEFKQDKT